MTFIGIFALVILFVIVMSFALMGNIHKDQEREFRSNLYDQIVDDADAVWRAKTSAKAYEKLSVMKAHREQFGTVRDRGVNDDLDQMYREAKEDADEIAREEWESKAEKTLDAFYEKFQLVIDGDFSDVDKLTAAKNRCLDLWYRYMQSPDSCPVTVYPKTFIREYLGDCFDPCMLSSDDLKKKLDDCIREHRPEADRKKKLIRQILRTVEQQESVMCSKLLSAAYENSTSDEVRYCYKELLAKNRLAEIKYGNRCFVTLSDKERARREKKSGPQNTEKTVSP